MRLRNNPKARDILSDNADLVILEPKNHKGKFYDLFGNSNPIYIEIGMGKGDFIIGTALKNPDKFFVGIEKYSAVASIAIKKISENNLDNVAVLVMDVCDSVDLLSGCVDTIFLNFSDPWPKDRHEKRRLTHSNQLKIYDSLFKGDAHIFLKTDNDDLFKYSLDSFLEYGYELLEVINDLHKSNKENVETEYERKFSAKGFNIKYVEAKKIF